MATQAPYPETFQYHIYPRGNQDRPRSLWQSRLSMLWMSIRSPITGQIGMVDSGVTTVFNAQKGKLEPSILGPCRPSLYVMEIRAGFSSGISAPVGIDQRETGRTASRVTPEHSFLE